MFYFGGFGFGFPPGPFGFLKHDQQYKEGYQRQDKKYRPALAVNGGIDHLGPQVNASSPMVKTRKPFRRMPSGITASINTARFQGVRKKT